MSQGIAPYTSSQVYVEFDTSIGKDEIDDGGEATYTLAGINYSLQIQARVPGLAGYGLQVYLQSMQTQAEEQGSTIFLGWEHDGVVSWALSGAMNPFSSGYC
ncbi:hypothetical protein C8R44DRAFT_881337 [Mycena epipterygia]|nr:hypothetical protein C8R44DRAFT_881337 [Mycena epipterygia]